MAEDKIIQKRRVNDVIKVTSTFVDEVSLTHADISVLINLIDHFDEGESFQNKLSSKLGQFGVNITDWLEKHIENDSTSQNESNANSTWSYKIKSIDTAHINEVQNIIQNESKAYSNSILINYSCSTLEDNAREKALLNNRQIAEKIASILCVKVLGISKEKVEVKCGDQRINDMFQAGSSDALNVRIEIKSEIEYKISRFSNFRYNLKVFRTLFDKKIIMKQVRLKIFEYWYYFSSKFFRRKNPISNVIESKRAIIVGHFSFPGSRGTFGDIEALEIVCDWLAESNIEFDVASNIEDGVDGVDISRIDESKYGIFIFVCGPWYPDGRIQSTLINKFNHCVKIGVNLTTFEEGLAGFDHLLSRDNFHERQADIAFAKVVKKIPVIGIILVDRQKKYGIKQRHLYIRNVITEYLKRGDIAPIWLDTNATLNIMNIWNKNQYESIVSRTDLVVTNRLHGVVLSLKNSVPVIAIDPVVGGGKVTAQVKALEWPILISAEEFSEGKLHQTITYCLRNNLQEALIKSQQQALLSIEETKNKFLHIVNHI
ncbi:MAG: polysaccharide pyruvyl transferase family protein [Anaerolineales bacterium]|nr:polysaccharide pyruvyl transferase family protein [Anaerolineales bacterium]